jgi:hypothetical protein
VLDAPLRGRWRREVERALALLDDALARTSLPSEARNRDAIESWLLDVRRRHF